MRSEIQDKAFKMFFGFFVLVIRRMWLLMNLNNKNYGCSSILCIS